MNREVALIRSELYVAKGEAERKIVKRLAKQFEDASLGNPEAALDFIVEILSTPDLYAKPRIDLFVTWLWLDKCKFEHTAKHKLVSALKSYYHCYENARLCDALGEMIGKCFERSEALELFDHLYPLSTEVGRKGIQCGVYEMEFRSRHQDEE